MVHLRRAKLNKPLAEWLKVHPSPVRRPKDRLTEVDIAQMVMAYQTGMATKELAGQYSINVKSVRKLVRERGGQTKVAVG